MAKKRIKDKTECTDKKCPFHGSVNTKNERIRAILSKKDLNRSATVVREKREYVKKYERYVKSTSRIRVHNPSCIDADEGDKVTIARTRPLSKTKNFVIIGVER